MNEVARQELERARQDMINAQQTYRRVLDKYCDSLYNGPMAEQADASVSNTDSRGSESSNLSRSTKIDNGSIQ